MMIQELSKEAVLHGDKIKVVSIEHLKDLKKEIEVFKQSEELNNYQKWIVNDLYNFDVPKVDFTIRSIIIVAISHSSYAKLVFENDDKKYDIMCPVMPISNVTEEYLREFLISNGYSIKVGPALPLKRLAVQSGLAVYGRNNITYVEGMGSFFSLEAYFSDMPCDSDNWNDIRIGDVCTNCKICINKCPTGAIRKNRFLIDNEKCLSYFNERPGEFPDWIPLSAYNCLYDCMKCQYNCPMNKDYVNNIIETIKFSEEETRLMLSGEKFEVYPEELRGKLKSIGMDQEWMSWTETIPRNMKVLFKSCDELNLQSM